MPPQKFTNEALIELFRKGINQRDAAERLGVSLGGVQSRIRSTGIDYGDYAQQRAQRARGEAVTAPVIEAPAPAPAAPAAVPGDIKATGGRYRDLCAFAEARGLTYAAALQQWHRARVIALPRRDE